MNLKIAPMGFGSMRALHSGPRRVTIGDGGSRVGDTQKNNGKLTAVGNSYSFQSHKQFGSVKNILVSLFFLISSWSYVTGSISSEMPPSKDHAIIRKAPNRRSDGIAEERDSLDQLVYRVLRDMQIVSNQGIDLDKVAPLAWTEVLKYKPKTFDELLSLFEASIDQFYAGVDEFYGKLEKLKMPDLPIGERESFYEKMTAQDAYERTKLGLVRNNISRY